MTTNVSALKPQPSAKEVLGKIVRNQLFIPLVALFLLIAFNLVTDPGFFKVSLEPNSAGNLVLSGNLITMIDYASELVILAIGMTLVTSASGGQDISVGATINIMMAAALAEGVTIIENAAKEPHVVDTANFLNSMGASIKGAGTDVIRIKGVQKLHGTNYSIIPDQIEAGTFMFAAAATRGDVVIKNVIPKHLESLTAKLMEMGCQIHESDDEVRVVATRRLGPTNAKTLPYPGFPTDMQPQITVLLGLSRGVSIITESIFENRFKYVDELTKMGAHIQVEGNTAIINGVEKYTGANLSSPDLRAGAALVIAALAAEGISEVYDIHYIERGYEDFPEKLRRLGAEIETIDSELEKRKFQFKVG